nr:MAG TPA: hypothetical protein [Caudoviricetes sp.]
MMETMTNTVIEIAANLVMQLAIIALTTVFAWLSAKIGKNKHLENINAAKDELRDAAVQTVGELNQLFVARWKAEAVDGKLTEAQIAKLGQELINLTAKKMSTSALKLLEAAGVDLTVYVQGVAEDWLNTLKGNGVGVGVITGVK